MVLYGITLFPLAEEMRDTDTTLLPPLYANDAAKLRLLIDQGPDRGYPPKPTKSLFIVENPEEKEAAKREFKWAGLNLNNVDCGRYLGAY